MLNRGSQLAALGLLALAFAAQPASAQGGARLRELRAQRQAGRQAQVGPNGGPGRGQPNARAMMGLPPKWVERLRDMSPEEQQQFLANDERFHQLPPARQEEVRRNLEKWNRLTPEQKDRAREAAKALKQMTPEQRQYLRNTLLPKWQAMPQDRKNVIKQHLNMLRNMSPGTQQAALNDPKFMQGLSPDEQSMLRDLNSFRNPAPESSQP